MYDTVLVATDGSDPALRAAEHGRYLADAFDATLHVVNVVDVEAAGGAFDAGGVTDEFVAQLEAEGEEAIERTVESFEADRIEVVRGSPAEAVLDYVDDHGVDLVAMGTHGRTGLHRFVAGSVTERVVRLSPVPVITTRETERTSAGSYEDLLVPTDGSDAAELAVDHALAVAEATGARVHALNVVDHGDLVAGGETTYPSDAFEQLESAGEDAVDSVASRARANGLDAVTEVTAGSSASQILDYADDHGVDLVVMGTHGRTGLERLLLGSTAERVVRRADPPVMTVSGGDRTGR